MAIVQGGKVGYNPDMYKLGFADNIAPSSAFNEELKKYGSLHYDHDGYYGYFGDAWSSFTIDERGRQYIKELDRQKDGPFKIKKISRFLFISFLLNFCLAIIMAIGLEIGIAWLICNINAYDSYSWLSGIFHGLFIVPNFIRHLFNEDILYFAEIHTTAYTIFYWLTAIFITILPQIKKILELIIELIGDWVYNRV